jgi:hypothetical protein
VISDQPIDSAQRPIFETLLRPSLLTDLSQLRAFFGFFALIFILSGLVEACGSPKLWPTLKSMT